MKYFTLLLFSLFLLQCGGETQDGQVSTDTAETANEGQTSNTSPAAPAATATYPSISNEKMKYLWDNCDYVDFVFYLTNFSMSQNNQASIRTTLAGVSTSVANVNPSCQPVGRIFFQVDGKNQEEADIFFTEGCIYYIFLENGSYAYAHQMTESGFDFYKKIFEQVNTTQAAG